MAAPPLRPAQNQWTPSRAASQTLRRNTAEAFNAATPVPFDRGTVEDWNAQGGYGFLRLDDTRKAYIHASKFGGGDLFVGLRLRVNVEADPRNPGKWSVAEVLLDQPQVTSGPYRSAQPSRPLASANAHNARINNGPSISAQVGTPCHAGIVS